jgi:hypothetical protein
MKMTVSIDLPCYHLIAPGGGSNCPDRKKGVCGLSELLWFRGSNKARLIWFKGLQ